jgi:uncharacterized repeat protein (TIGR01451 family)
MIQKLYSIILIAVLLLSAGSITPTKAQDETLPNKPGLKTLSQLEEYIQKSFSKPAVSGKALLSGQLAPIYSPSLSPQLLDKAPKDECFNGVGQPYSGTVGIGCTDSPFFPNSQPKVNQSYVWGLTQHGNDLFFGTAANPHCMVYGGLLQSSDPSSLETDSYVCEFGDSRYASLVGIYSLGDWRPPKAYAYNTTGLTKSALPEPASPGATVTFSETLGLRSAATYGDLIFLAGPALHTNGINLFAYYAPDHTFISSTVITGYTNVRRWVNVGEDLYVGVAKAVGGGTVLRYTGSYDHSIPADLTNLFNFEEVGIGLGGDAAEITLFNNRLYVNTWPNLAAPTFGASLWMSPPLDDPLTASDSLSWQRVWLINSYEPDPITAALTGGGAMAAADGWLYWGTMHVPFSSFMTHMKAYPPNPAWDYETLLTYEIAGILGSHRAISIFRGRNFDTVPEIQLVYGEQQLPVFKNGSWQILPNNMLGTAPLYGPSGFGNFYNNYTWSMGTYHDELYIGTMDWSYLLQDGIAPLWSQLGLPEDTVLPLPDATPGADLWRIHDQYSVAQPINISGVGNELNYGIRTMVANSQNMYLGTANPMNLLPGGGWELVKMVSSPDLAIEKWATPEMVTVGSTFTYTLRVTNYGFAAAPNVRVHDELQTGVSFISDNLSACLESSPGSGQIYCSLGNLAANDGFTPPWIDLEIYVTAPGTQGYVYNNAFTYCDVFDPNSENDITHLFTLVDVPTELGVTKTANRDWVGPGQNLEYRVNVTNSSSETYVPLLPLNLHNPNNLLIPTYGMASPYPATQTSVAGVRGEVQNASVKLHGLNHARTADLDVMLVSPEGTKVLLMSNAGGGLNFSSMDLTFTDGYPPLPQSTPIVTGTYQPTSYSLIPPVFPGAPSGPMENQLAALQGENPNGVWRLYIYDHQLGYGGFIEGGWTLNLTMKRGLLFDTLPEETTFDYYASLRWVCDEGDPDELTCYMPANLGPGESAPLTFYTLVTDESPSFAFDFRNFVSLVPGGIDLDPTNNTAEVYTTFYPSPDVEIQKSTIYGDTPIPPGATFTYTLDVSNSSASGVGPASGVYVEDDLPTDVNVVSADPRCNSVSPGETDVDCDNLGELWPGDHLNPPLVITVTAPNTVTWITNRAEAGQEQIDADADNVAYLWSLVDLPTDLEIVKTASLENVQIDQPVDYTLRISNLGPGAFVSKLPFQINNPETIDIPAFGVADPYPSAMPPLSGLDGKIANVAVTLTYFDHQHTKDLELLLVGPNGKGVILMSGAGTCTSSVSGDPCQVEAVTITFDDAASGTLPKNDVIGDGTYQPTDYGMVHLFPYPAPLGPYANKLSAFNGLDPNGTWQLFVLDKGLLYNGEIELGWTLNLTLARQVTVHDQLPQAISYDQIQPGIWDCKFVINDVLCTTDNPPVSSEILLGVTTRYTSNLTISNTATVQTDSYDPDLSNNLSVYVMNQWKWWLPVIQLFMP